MRQTACALLLFAISTLSAAAYQNAAKDPDPGQSSASAGKSVSNESSSNDSGHNWHLRLGTIGVGAGYASGPFYPYPYYRYAGYYPGAFWDPFWDPLWNPYYADAPLNLAYAHGKGEVKLSGAPKDAKIYVDAAYAGAGKDLKSIWLDPGAYDLSVVSAGHETFKQRIYVLTGKTLKIAANEPPNIAEEGKP